MPLFRTVTLGCKVNQYETEYVRQGLLSAGYREAVAGEAADLCIVNTCTVTVESDYKSRKIIRALARENPQSGIVVMGCYATRAQHDVSSLPQVIHVLADKQRLPQLVRELAGVEPPSGISSFGRLHRAYVKIQDGCPGECSYCIVPKVRSRLVSRPIEEVAEEVHRLVDHGHREIVLTGIHLGCYGADLPADGGAGVDLEEGAGVRREAPQSVGNALRGVPGSGIEASAAIHGTPQRAFPTGRSGAIAGSHLMALLGRLVALDGEFRIRLSSLEANEVTPDLLDLMVRFPDRMCPHLHLPLQSGSNAVLARMKRRTNVESFLAQCREIRRALDAPALTTDVIVGFPGETEADFEATCRAVEEAAFCRVHVFRYSAREGTPAATFPDQIPPPVKQRRAEVLNGIGGRLRTAYCASLVGRELQVVAESPREDRPTLLSGTADRYVTVRFPGGPELMNKMLRVAAVAVADGCLLGSDVRVSWRP